MFYPGKFDLFDHGILFFFSIIGNFRCLLNNFAQVVVLLTAEISPTKSTISVNHINRNLGI